MLKTIYESEADIPEALKSEYTKNGDGKWSLEIEGGLVPAARLDEFRTNNTNLLRERDQTLTPRIKAYEAIGTPEELTHLKSISDQLDETKLVRSNKVEEAVQKRLEKANEDHSKTLKKETDRANGLEARLSVMMIDQESDRLAISMGADPGALKDIRSRVRERVKMVDGKVVGYKTDKPDEIDYGKSGQGLTIKEILEDLEPEKHLWLASKGAHSEAQKRAGGGGIYAGPNVWKRGPDFNLSKQMEIAKKDPPLAKRLREEAGLNR